MSRTAWTLDNETFDATHEHVRRRDGHAFWNRRVPAGQKRRARSRRCARIDVAAAGAPPVEIDGHKYVDGGVADSVPIEHVLEEAGFDRAVVIVTQDRSYEKKPYEFMPAARARYADYPYLLEAIETRHDRYNIQRMHLWKYEREGRALVVAPQKPVEVGHVEHDSAKLLDLYIQGRQEAKRLLAEIQEFVER